MSWEGPYPYMACPRDSEPMDDLEGCHECNGVGYHHSIPNPEYWDKDDDA